MEFDSERVLANARKSSTEDLLDRVTVYRAGMEPEAIDIIEAELRRRGVTREQQETHQDRRADALMHDDGVAVRCSFCHAPAVKSGLGWHRLWRIDDPRAKFFRLVISVGCFAVLLYAFLEERLRASVFALFAAIAAWAAIGLPVFPRTFHYCTEHDPEL